MECRTLAPSYTRTLGYPAKRAVDVLLASVALLLLAPVLAMLAVAIRLTSRGPIVYRQVRVGRDGRLFQMVKLRTMIDGAEEGTGPVLASPADARITRLGRRLRALRLDEIPQFLNVLRGEMSIVGPRPERPCFVSRFEQQVPGYARRHAVRPGITGLAQIRRGYRAEAAEKLVHDLEYLERVSPWLDLWIMARTFPAIWRRRDE